MTTPQMSRFKKPLLSLAAACSSAIIVAGCSGAGGQPTLAPAGSTENTDPLPTQTQFTGANVYIGGTDADSTVSNFAGFLSTNSVAAGTTTMGAGFDEGIAIESLSDKLFRAGINAGAGAIRLTCDAAFNASAFTPDMGDPQLNREITLGGVGATPKGIALADQAGLIFVASNDSAIVEVFSQAAGGTATPVATFTATGNPWDVVYDAGTDRLFTANTNGTVDYYAGAVAAIAAGTAGAPTSSFTTADAVNFHGIVYLPGDLLIVSDVGLATDATDGALFYFSGASNLTGTVTPARSIAGAATTLGNPVDLQTDGSDLLLVAEKSNNAILEYSTDPAGASGNVAPTNSVAFDAPESLFYKNPRAATAVSDATDFDGTAATLLATGGGMGGTVNFLELDLSGTQGAAFTLPATSTVQNVNYNQEGDAYITFDDAAGDGVLVVSRILGRDGDLAAVGSFDRSIVPSAAFTAPKGIEVSIADGLFMVADAGASTITGFGLCQDGAVAPLFTVDVTDTAGYAASVWDLDYDSGADTLFVAGTNGQLLIYEDFVATATDDEATDPQQATFLVTITTTDGGAALANMHGIIVEGGTLIASDVGAATTAGTAGFDTDGQIVVVSLDLSGDDEDTGTEDVTDLTLVPEFTIAGPNSLLGNPVDVAFDGTDLWVAEKANAGGQVLLFNDILDLDPTAPTTEPAAANLGDVSDIAPDATTALAGAESVAVISDAAGSGL